MRRSIHLAVLASLATSLVCGTAWAQSQAANAAAKLKPEVYTGTVIGIGGTMGGVSRGFTLSISGYTSDEDTQRFLDALKEFKQDGLLKAISKEKKGWVAVDGHTGRDINVIRTSMTEDGKQRIAIFFERWLQMYEVRQGTRSRDYPFAFGEFFIDEKGKGVGTFVPMAKIKFVVDKKSGKRTVELENFGTYPAHVILQRRK
jgi:hypothetical protein